jgi:hypothetical protein
VPGSTPAGAPVRAGQRCGGVVGPGVSLCGGCAARGGRRALPAAGRGRLHGIGLAQARRAVVGGCGPVCGSRGFT